MATFRKGVRAIQLVGRASEFSNKNVSYTLFIAKKLIHTKCIKNKVHFHTNTNSANYEWKMKANIWMYFISSSNVPLVLYIFYFVQWNVNIITLLLCYQCYSLLFSYSLCHKIMAHIVSCLNFLEIATLFSCTLYKKPTTHTLISHTFFGISNITTCIVLRQSFFFERDLLKSMCNYNSLVKVIFILSQPKL